MMRGKKNMIYRNSLGQEVVFDNRVLYLEAIDMIGTPGIHAVEGLAGSDGQRTISHQLGAKTIPCSLAIRDVGNVEWLKHRLTEVFFPKLTGTMTVITPFCHYEIDCYPINVPSFRMAENDGAWRFDVDFVADYPYWRKGGEHVETLTDTFSQTLESHCPFDIPPVIEYPEGNSLGLEFRSGSQHGAVYVNEHSFPVRLTTMPFSMINMTTGASCTNYLSATENIGNILIRYGTNTITGFSGSKAGVVLRYYDLSMGEI